MSQQIEPHQVGLSHRSLPPVPRHSLRLVLDQVRSAYNVGALFRTADGAAIECLYLLGLTPHPPHPQVEKTALGATEYVPWKHRLDGQEVVQELLAEGYQLVALENGPEAEDLWSFQWPEKTALVAGNEVEGISQELLAQCPLRLNLPMQGYKRTLNVTTALGIAIYDYLRVWSARESGSGD